MYYICYVAGARYTHLCAGCIGGARSKQFRWKRVGMEMLVVSVMLNITKFTII